MKFTRLRRAAGIVVLAASVPAHAASPPDYTDWALQVLKQSVAFRTVLGQGQVPAYAGYLAGILRESGFAAADITITPYGETATLVARYRGTNPAAKPLVLAAHMDVVEAHGSDWERDPFTAVVEDGYIYGRGVYDNKFGIANLVITLVRLKDEGFQPSRDIVLALTGDEETSQETTALLAEQLKGAELLLNSDGGGGLLGEDGQPLVYSVQAAEKTYADFEIRFANPGGHSSRPHRDNAIYSMARAIGRIAGYTFPRQSTELTTAYFRATGAVTPGPLGEAMRRYADDPTDAAAIETIAAEPEFVGQLGTTCVATMVEGGHALNALPQSAAVSVNCRIFPGVSIDNVKDTLAEVIADPGAEISILGKPEFSGASPLRADVMAAVRRAVDLRYPGLTIVPGMSAGATDSLYFRKQGVPSFGTGGLFMKASDDYAHGLNERVPVDAMEGALRHWHSLLTDLAR